MDKIHRQLIDIYPLGKEGKLLQLLAKQFQPGFGSGVLFHVLYEAVALKVAGELAVDQEAALCVPIRPNQFLKLLQGERGGQVGDAQQGIRRLQLNPNFLVPEDVFMEPGNRILCLFSVRQSDEGWKERTDECSIQEDVLKEARTTTDL